MLRFRTFPLLVCLATIPGVSPAQPPATPGVEVVLERAGAYVTAFQRHLSGVVAEERYVQEIRTALPSYPIGGVPPASRGRETQRVLRSDLLLVKPIGSDRWIQFRDVFEVDGKPVHDRNERLVKLFLEPTSSSAAQAEQIVRESSRYNIGSVQRNIRDGSATYSKFRQFQVRVDEKIAPIR